MLDIPQDNILSQIVPPVFQITHGDLDGDGCLMLSKVLGITKTSGLVAHRNEKKQIDNRPDPGYFCTAVDSFVKNYQKNCKTLLITDIGIDLNFAKYLKDKVGKHINIVIIDHHEATLEKYDRLNIIKDTSISATQLFFNELLKFMPVEKLGKYKDLVNAINSFDTWKLDSSPLGLDMQRVFETARKRKVFGKNGCKCPPIINLIDLADKMFQQPPSDTFKPEWFMEYLDKYHTGIKTMDGKIKNTETLINEILETKKGRENCTVFYFLNKIGNFKPPEGASKKTKKQTCLENALPEGVLAPVKFHEKKPSVFEISVWADENNIGNRIFVIEDNGGYTFSLRAGKNEKNIKLNEIASKWGGNGHWDASSFNIIIHGKIDVNPLTEPDEDKIIRQEKEKKIIEEIIDEITNAIQNQTKFLEPEFHVI